ncbi:MAG: hypothetical protein ABIK53_09090 [bacterium]
MPINNIDYISKRKRTLLCRTALAQGAKIMATRSKQGCRYHMKDTEIFNFSQLTPEGLCIHAFHSVYASCLKLLYTGKKNNIETPIFCPNTNGSIEFEIIGKKHSNILQRLLNGLKYYLRCMGIPCDYQIKRIFIKVTGVKDVCPMGHKEGDIFEFNLGNKSEICPASFESLYPMICSLSLQEQFKKEVTGQNNSVCLQCPSHLVSIKYSIPSK